MNATRSITKFALLPTAVLSLAVLASASMTTIEDQHSFSYIGQLSQKGIPYSGSADVTFTLWDSRQGGSAVAATQRMNNIAIKDGMFKVPLSFDDEVFGKKAKRWLEVTIRAPSGKGLFTTLTPRREVARNGSLNSGNSNRFDNRNEDIQLLAPDWFINAPNSIYLNIDSDNDSTTAILEIAKHRTGDTGGTSLLVVQEDGNVGIGTSTPQARFHLDAGSVSNQTPFQVVGEDFETGLIARFRRSNQNEPSITMLTVGNNTAILASEKSWRFDTDATGNSVGTPRMTILHGSGNVGIGETTPSAKLDVVGTTELNGAVTINGDVGINSNLVVDTDSLFVNGSTNRVGIGTTAPANALHVVGGPGDWTNLADGVHIGEDEFGSTHIELVDGNGQTPYIDFLESNTGDADARIRLVNGKLEVFSLGELSLVTDADLLLGTFSGPKVTLKQSGNVGIGTTTPSARLSLSEQLRLFDSTPPDAAAATDAGYLFGPSIPSGMVTEVSGQLLDFGVNIPVIGPRDINRVGGLVRIDTRFKAASQSFNIQGFPIGSDGNIGRLFINLNTGQTNLAPGGGNVAIGTFFDPIHPLEMASGAHVTAGGVWTDSSDANRKENINPVDAREILKSVRDLPISTWNFKDENESIRHLGPMAQDFHAAFALGADNKHLASLDSAGVALAAIQGLDELMQEKEKEITDLKARLAALEALVERLVMDRNAGAP